MKTRRGLIGVLSTSSSTVVWRTLPSASVLCLTQINASPYCLASPIAPRSCGPRVLTTRWFLRSAFIGFQESGDGRFLASRRVVQSPSGSRPNGGMQDMPGRVMRLLAGQKMGIQRPKVRAKASSTVARRCGSPAVRAWASLQVRVPERGQKFALQCRFRSGSIATCFAP